MKTRFPLITLALASGIAHAEPADIDAGTDLYAESCANKCHGTEVFTRADRKMQRYQSLLTQVGRCEQALGLQWFEDDIHNVSAYLNQAFYKFPTD